MRMLPLAVPSLRGATFHAQCVTNDKRFPRFSRSPWIVLRVTSKRGKKKRERYTERQTDRQREREREREREARVRVFLSLMAYSACRESCDTLRTCHVHSVLRIHAWHYVCARRRRAADVLWMHPFCSLWVVRHAARAHIGCPAAIPDHASDTSADVAVCHPRRVLRVSPGTDTGWRENGAGIFMQLHTSSLLGGAD